MKKDITAGEGCRGGIGGGREDRQRPWRRSLQQHPSVREIARTYNVSHSTISRLKAV